VKQIWLDIAEIVDALRVFPRFMVISYWTTVLWMLAQATKLAWAGQLTMEYSGVVAVATGLATMVTNFYMKTGRKWTGQERIGG